jgi:hypothetical protein
VTPSATITGLESSGFTIVNWRDMVAENLAFGARSRAMLERGEKPPHRAVHLMHGDLATDAVANTARAYKEARLVPIEVFCRKVNR